uniref:F5/8 type C domain-containing protein n=1 Tax=Branchiostoma floridae TaxID=7739 RepID=C3ZT62_BRAFL|eukprot:XP_002588257.1 hypothetical protein BRAFLDRAFT_86705 [Branchiostoma floridae]
MGNSTGIPWVYNGVIYDVSKAFDGDTRTHWNPGEVGRYYNNWYIVLDLAASTTLTRIAVNNYGDIEHDIANFTLQKSQVGSPYSWEGCRDRYYRAGRDEPAPGVRRVPGNSAILEVRGHWDPLGLAAMARRTKSLHNLRVFR